MFRKFHRKTPVLESLFIKFTGPRHVTLLKRDSNTGVFLWKFAKFLRTTFFTGQLRCVLLDFNIYWHVNISFVQKVTFQIICYKYLLTSFWTCCGTYKIYNIFLYANISGTIRVLYVFHTLPFPGGEICQVCRMAIRSCLIDMISQSSHFRYT